MSSPFSHLHGGYFKVLCNSHFHFFLADFTSRQFSISDVFEELFITPRRRIFSTLCRIAGNSSEIYYLLPSCLFQTYISALSFKLLTLGGRNFFRGLVSILRYLKASENTGAGSGEKVGGGRDWAGKGTEGEKQPFLEELKFARNQSCSWGVVLLHEWQVELTRSVRAYWSPSESSVVRQTWVHMALPFTGLVTLGRLLKASVSPLANNNHLLKCFWSSREPGQGKQSIRNALQCPNFTIWLHWAVFTLTAHRQAKGFT